MATRMSNPFDFGAMFRESRGGPIVHAGTEIVMADRVPAKLNEVLTVTIESTRSRWPQGIGISTGLMVFGERVARAVIWEYFSLPPTERAHRTSALPFTFEVTCRNRAGALMFYNMAERDHRADWWHAGCAMRVSSAPGVRRYHCNDVDLDDDFDDIVFSVACPSLASG